jgi:hypothetical protein
MEFIAVLVCAWFMVASLLGVTLGKIVKTADQRSQCQELTSAVLMFPMKQSGLLVCNQEVAAASHDCGYSSRSLVRRYVAGLPDQIS